MRGACRRGVQWGEARRGAANAGRHAEALMAGDGVQGWHAAAGGFVDRHLLCRQ